MTCSNHRPSKTFGPRLHPGLQGGGWLGHAVDDLSTFGIGHSRNVLCDFVLVLLIDRREALYSKWSFNHGVAVK